MTTIALDELIRYWRRELPGDREAEVEEAIFADAATARRLDAIARLDAGVRALVAAGRLQGTLTVDTIDALRRAGLAVRQYIVDAGHVVPCTIADEDLVVIRLRGEFASAHQIDVVMDGSFDGLPPASERYDDVAVDRRAGEIVLVYPGERVRALPRSRFRYTVTGDGRALGEWGLDHSPRA